MPKKNVKPKDHDTVCSLSIISKTSGHRVFAKIEHQCKEKNESDTTVDVEDENNDSELLKFILTRVVLGGLAFTTSLLASLFVNSYFMGSPLIDAFTVFGIGFLAYRAQDLKTLLRREDK